jgi:hypothetical protein
MRMAKDNEEEERPWIVSRKQVRKRRKDGWSKRDERVFFKHFRMTCNASASARAAGKSPSSAFDLRERDPVVAAKWDKALREADVRLDGKMIVYAETKGKEIAPNEDGEPAEPGMADFDPEFALKLRKYHDARRSGGRRHDGTNRRRATIEELTRSIRRHLAVLRKRRAKRAGA